MALATARASGVEEALAEISTEHPELGIYILSWARADCIFHWLSRSRSLDLCVDLGSGWGTLAIALSEYFKDIVSIDVIPQRLALQSLRFKHESVANISLVRASVLEAPVRVHTADLVVANGVLEWVPLDNPNASVTETQLKFLRACKSMLKQGWTQLSSRLTRSQWIPVYQPVPPRCGGRVSPSWRSTAATPRDHETVRCCSWTISHLDLYDTWICQTTQEGRFQVRRSLLVLPLL